MDLIAYLRVSTEEQGDSGLGLGAQRQQIHAYAAAYGHTIVSEHTDVASGSDMNRPALTQTLSLLASSEADGLIAAKLDRLSRSVPDFGTMLERARAEQWSFIAIDLNVDTSTPTGELIANVMMAVAQWERRTIGQRTSEALQAKKANGHRLGRPVNLPASTRLLIQAWHAQGWNDSAIARGLNHAEVPTAQQGRRWYPGVVSGVLKSLQLDDEATATVRLESR
jgi:DNA invertase Pin-like site-specific DNA recombinase